MGKLSIFFTDRASEELAYWMQRDANVCKKIGVLLVDIQRYGNIGKGKPEALKYNLQGWWSRRITDEHRLVYRIDEEDGTIFVLQCRGHYND